MAKCQYEALSYLWSGVQEWEIGNHLSNIRKYSYQLTFRSSIPDSDLDRHGAHGDTNSMGRSAGAESGLAIYEKQRKSDAAYQNDMRFRLVSLSTIINRITGRIQQLETGEVGLGKLHSECTRIKGILEALKSACDKSSCLEYVPFPSL
jgi:hypothetical protein